MARREHTVGISRERYALRQEILKEGFQPAGSFSRKAIECGESSGGDMCLNAKSLEDIIRS